MSLELNWWFSNDLNQLIYLLHFTHIRGNKGGVGGNEDELIRGGGGGVARIFSSCFGLRSFVALHFTYIVESRLLEKVLHKRHSDFPPLSLSLLLISLSLSLSFVSSSSSFKSSSSQKMVERFFELFCCVKLR
jgi:hypothetical protein